MPIPSWVEGARNRLGIAGELLGFLWAERLWWMVPMVVVLLGLGLVLAFAASSPALAPFIYTIF